MGKLVLIIIGLITSYCSPIEIFAQNQPWHLEINNIAKAWETSTGSKTVVIIVDTKIEDNVYLKEKTYEKSSNLLRKVYKKADFIAVYNENKFQDNIHGFSNELFKSAEDAYKFYSHGTNMASIILLDRTSIPFEDDPRHQIEVSGVAPDARFTNFPFGIDFGSYKIHPSILDVLEEVKDEITRIQKKVKKIKGATAKERSLSRVFTINLSAMEQASVDSRILELFYRDWLTEISKKNDLLLIAASGNDHLNLDKECSLGKIQPVCLKSRVSDLILKVGSVITII